MEKLYQSSKTNYKAIFLHQMIKTLYEKELNFQFTCFIAERVVFAIN